MAAANYQHSHDAYNDLALNGFPTALRACIGYQCSAYLDKCDNWCRDFKLCSSMALLKAGVHIPDEYVVPTVQLLTNCKSLLGVACWWRAVLQKLRSSSAKSTPLQPRSLNCVGRHQSPQSPLTGWSSPVCCT
jgi:hypothetical protein